MNISGFTPPDNQTFSEIISMPENVLFTEVLENLGSPVALLKPDRTIAYANSLFLKLAHSTHFDALLALRLGEGFDCIHLEDGETCGETSDCHLCGVNQAITGALQDKTVIKECRILKKQTNEALDLEVTANKITIQNLTFILVTITDISHKKRRRSLERIFYHDILNGVSSLQIACELIERDSDKTLLYTNEIRHTVRRLLSDINAQKLLSAAEDGDLKPNKETFSASLLLEDLTSEFNTLSRDRLCHVIVKSEIEAEFLTDYALLSRVLINTVKNALEASDASQTVTVKVEKSADSILFAVHNQNMIPEELQHQIFKRSFSTKGTDRGIGTYSIKILTENYLGGKVNFTSTQESGTTFFISVPLVLL